MRLLWLGPLLLASICLSSASEDQPSCGVEEGSGCSVAPTYLRVPRDEEESLHGIQETSRSTRSIKTKRRTKSHRPSRITRSAQEEIDLSGEEAPTQEHSPRPLYSEEQMSLQLQGNLRNLMKQIQAAAFLPTTRYCPHCRQPLPSDQSFLHQPIDPRMFLPVQNLPRIQAIPMNTPFPVLDESKDFSSYDDTKRRQFVPEEFCPFNYRLTTEDEGQSQAHPDLFNQTSPSPNKYKEFKKTPAGLSDSYMDREPHPMDETSPNPSFNKMEMGSYLKQSKLPAIEEITKYLEKKKTS